MTGAKTTDTEAHAPATRVTGGPPASGQPPDGGAGAHPAAGVAVGDLRNTVRWGSAFVLGPAAVLLVAVLWRTHGTFVYTLDDPAIHLTVARRLAYDGTWGIVAGEFQAASSSPLWTLLLAPTQLVVRGSAGELVPLALNLVAALWVVRLLGPELHRVLRPSLRRPLDLAATAVVVVALLYLPGLAFFGLEHTLHMAVVLATVLAVERRWAQPSPSVTTGPEPSARLRAAVRRLWDAPPAWLPFVLIGLATLARGESAFVAVGIATALVTTRPMRSEVQVPGATRSRGHLPLPPWFGVAAGIGFASAAALALVAAVNLAFGQGWLPNSVLAKSFGDRGDTRRSVGAALERLLDDPLLVALCVVALLVLLREWRRAGTRAPAGDSAAATQAADRPLGRWDSRAGLVYPAVVFLVATLLHVELGAVEPTLRYEGYLLGLGVLMLLRLLADLAPAAVRAAVGGGDGRTAGPAKRSASVASRPWLAAVLVLLMALPAGWQIRRTLVVSGNAEGMWEQRYQVARFLDEAYSHEPIAIGELGYISLYHDGPLTDVYGLGDHEVLQATLDDRKDADLWRELQARRGFPILVTYDFSIAGQHPTEWYLTGTWRSPDAYFETTQFWATTPEAVVPLLRHLEAYEPKLPDGVEVSYNHMAAWAASAAMSDEDRTITTPP